MYLFQLWITRSKWMWENNTPKLHSWEKKIRFWKHMGTRWGTWYTGKWRSRPTCWLYATGISVCFSFINLNLVLTF